MRDINRTDKELIKKIISYCDDISGTNEMFQNSREAFFTQKHAVYCNACATCITQIGELVARLSDEAKQRYSNIPWRDIKYTRNVFVHRYGSIDKEIAWRTVQEDIPELKRQCEEILSSWPEDIYSEA